VNSGQLGFVVSPPVPNSEAPGPPVKIGEMRRCRGSETCWPARHFGWIGTFWRVLPAKTGWISVETYLSMHGVDARLPQTLLPHPQYEVFEVRLCGDSEGNQLRQCRYHSTVAGVTFVRYWRSRIDCSKRGSTISSKPGGFWRKISQVVDNAGE
jgi:hypothetical protein